MSLTGASLVGMVSVASVAAAAPPPPAAIGEHPQGQRAALAKAADTGKRVEVVSERGQTETVFANPNGTLTSEISQKPIRVKDQAGSWRSIDLTLGSTAPGRIGPAAGPMDVTFSATGAGELATLRTTAGPAFSLNYGQKVDKPALQKDSATYRVPGAPESVQIKATNRGFTARVVLPAAPTTAPSYTFPLTLNGLKPSLDANVLYLKDSTGAVVAQSARLTMWDSSRDASGDRANQVPVDAALVTKNGATALVLTPSIEWLRNPRTSYPVTVDPDVSSVDVLTDTYTNANSPTVNYIGDSRLVVGTPDGNNRYRSYVGFRTADFNGRDISSATLKLYQYYAKTCTPKQLNVAAAYNTDTSPDSPVPTNTLTWEKQDGTAGHLAVVDNLTQWSTNSVSSYGTTGCASNWVNVDVTRMVNGWTSGTTRDADNKVKAGSFALRAGSESDATFEKRFCSGNPDTATACNSDTLEPVLSLSYYPALGSQSWYSMTSHPLNDRSSLMVNNENGNAVVQANDLKLNGQGLDLEVDRFYNSQSTEAATSLGTGGWSMSVGPDVYLEAGTSSYRYDYHAPGGTRFGAFVRQSTDSTSADYKKFWSPSYGGLDADLNDNGDGTVTMTFHHSQQKYVFKKADPASDNYYLSALRDRSGNQININYAASSHKMSSISDTVGRSITITYDGTSDRITTLSSTATSPARTWTYGYTGTQLTSYTDPAGKSTTYSTGVLSSITAGQSNESGTAPRTTLAYSPGKAVTNVTYLRQNTVKTAVSAVDASFNFDYFTPTTTESCPGSPDRWTKVTDQTAGDAAYQQGPTYCFRDRHNGDLAIDVHDALGHDKSTSYSADNQASSSTTASNSGITDGSTSYQYGADLTDQLSSVTEPKDDTGDTAGQTLYDYGNSSSVAGGKWLPTSVRDADKNCSKFQYDSQGRTTDASIGFQATTGSCADQNPGTDIPHFHKSYNSDGSVSSSYDGNGNDTVDQRTNYTYFATADGIPNIIGQLKTLVRPGGSCLTASRHLCTSYTYDGAARVQTVTDGRGKVTRYTYDAIDRVTMVQLNGATTCTTADIAAGNCVTYAFDAEGNLTTRSDAKGTSTFTYDRANRQVQQTLPGSVVVVSKRDGTGNLIKLTQTIAGKTEDVTYTYDAANRPDKVTDPTGVYNIDTDADGRTSVIDYPSGSGYRGTFDYTKRGKPKTFEYKSGTTSMLKYVYGYKVGTVDVDKLQTEKSTGSIPGVNVDFTYTYNKSGQLEKAQNAGGSTFQYVYDKGGNLTKASQTNGGTTNTTWYGYDRAGELCWSGTSSLPTGQNQIDTACPSLPSGYTPRTSDHAGNNLGTSAASNSYNGNSQASTVGNVGQAYLDLGNDLRASAGSNTFVNGPLGVTGRANGTTVTFYTRDPNGQLLGEHVSNGSSPTGTRFYLADYQSSVSALVGPTGTLMGSYAYDPYGRTDLNALSGGTTAADNPWRYTGGYYDNEGDGNYKLGARFYDGAGHFTQPDSVQGSIEDPKTLNSYAYTGGDPINHTDPSGNLSEETCSKVNNAAADAYAFGGAAGILAGGVTLAGAPQVGIVLGIAAGLGGLEGGVLNRVAAYGC